jgi:hypothetical protein
MEPRFRTLGQRTIGIPVTFLWVACAVAALAVAAGLYIVDRSPADVYLFPSALAFPGAPVLSAGVLGGSLPSFLHVFAFILFTAAVLGPRTVRSTAAIAAAWCVTDILFELGQYPLLAPRIAAALPHWFRNVPLLDNVGPYFLRGTFDPADMAAIVVGAAFAYLTITWTREKGGVS